METSFSVSESSVDTIGKLQAIGKITFTSSLGAVVSYFVVFFLFSFLRFR